MTDSVPPQSPDARRDDDREVSVTMPVRYWISVLDALQLSCASDRAELKHLGPEGKTQKDLTAAESTAYAAPLFARAILVETLVSEGVMTPEARDKIGGPLLRDLIRRSAEEGLD